jgi:hypothetical protein
MTADPVLLDQFLLRLQQEILVIPPGMVLYLLRMVNTHRRGLLQSERQAQRFGDPVAWLLKPDVTFRDFSCTWLARALPPIGAAGGSPRRPGQAAREQLS